MYEIILGRNETDRKKYGKSATIFLGKHYVTMEQEKSLANPILLDIARPHVILVSGKRGSGKCLEENTFITLNNGEVLPIKELETNEEQIFALQEDLKINPALKTNFYKRKVDKLLHLMLRSGREIKLTPEHPLLTILGWKSANELGIGSRIATPRKLPSFGNKELPEHKIKLLAYLIAEGSLRNGFVLFSNSDSELLVDFNQSVREFDTNLKTSKHGHGSYRVSQIKKRYIMAKEERDTGGRFVNGGARYQKSSINAWLSEEGLYNLLSLEKFIPKSILTLPKYQLALFLNRLFSCDGSIYKHKTTHGSIWQISYSSSSEKLIKQVQHLLLRFGILSRLRHKKVKCSGKIFKSFELVIGTDNIERFIEEISFFGVKQKLQKQAITDLAEIRRNPNVDTVPNEIWQIYKPENWAEIGRGLEYKIPKSLRESQRYSPSRQKLMQIALVDSNPALYKLATSDIFWDEIAEIKELNGEFTVYDISVPEYHNFIANDIIVHNSYTLGVMAEGLMDLPKEIKENLSCIIFDTMGIYWTSKYPNYRDDELLRVWGLDAKKMEPTIFVPKKMFQDYQKKSIPVDKEFSINPAELGPEEWCSLFSIELNSESGVLIENVVLSLKEEHDVFSIEEIIKKIQSNKSFPDNIKRLLLSRFESISKWGVFDEDGVDIDDLVKSGQVSVLDLSAFSNLPESTIIKSLVIGFISRKILQKRLLARKQEEVEQIEKGFVELRTQEPLVWMLIDEAHEFIPNDKATLATGPLIQLLREGRQPGISLIMATQQPGKIHTDALTQADIVISHRLTARIDVNALNEIMQSYLPFALQRYIDNLPKDKGAAITLDDNSEKIYPFKVRPRLSWHGGEDPSAVRKIRDALLAKRDDLKEVVRDNAKKQITPNENVGQAKLERGNLFERVEKLGGS